MKKIFITVAAIIIASSTIIAQDLQLNEILDKFYKANGFDKLLNIKTVIMSGTITQNDNMPVKIYRVRPDKYLMEYDVQDITAYQVYDGKTAWMTAPWTGSTKPQLLPPDRAKDLIARADFDGTIYNWKDKGHNIELVEQDTVNKVIAYKLKLTRKDGGIEFYAIDKSTFMLLKKTTFRMARGKEIAVDNYYSDYRNIEGVLFYFISENQMDGQPYSTIQFDTIEVNKPIDEKKFEMPVK